MYSAQRGVVREEVRKCYKNIGRHRKAEVNPMSDVIGRRLPGSLDADANEHWLFHACRPTDLLTTLKSGLTNKVAKDGVYGSGLYFAEDIAKIDQYTAPILFGSEVGMTETGPRDLTTDEADELAELQKLLFE